MAVPVAGWLLGLIWCMFDGESSTKERAAKGINKNPDSCLFPHIQLSSLRPLESSSSPSHCVRSVRAVLVSHVTPQVAAIPLQSLRAVLTQAHLGASHVHVPSCLPHVLTVLTITYKVFILLASAYLLQLHFLPFRVPLGVLTLPFALPSLCPCCSLFL